VLGLVFRTSSLSYRAPYRRFGCVSLQEQMHRISKCRFHWATGHPVSQMITWCAPCHDATSVLRQSEPSRRGCLYVHAYMCPPTTLSSQGPGSYGLTRQVNNRVQLAEDNANNFVSLKAMCRVIATHCIADINSLMIGNIARTWLHSVERCCAGKRQQAAQCIGGAHSV
jgi:hypothetical protein